MREMQHWPVSDRALRLIGLLVILLLLPVSGVRSQEAKSRRERVRIVWDYAAEDRQNVVSFDVWRVNASGKRLEKLGSWKEPDTPTETNPMTIELPYGTHTIQVVARDKDGVESEAATLKLKVERPKKRPAPKPPVKP